MKIYTLLYKFCVVFMTILGKSQGPYQAEYSQIITWHGLIQKLEVPYVQFHLANTHHNADGI